MALLGDISTLDYDWERVFSNFTSYSGISSLILVHSFDHSDKVLPLFLSVTPDQCWDSNLR